MISRSPVTDAEMERRWALTRTALQSAGLDAVLVHGTNDWLGGHVRWLTDIPATNGYPRSVIFYAHRPMSVIEMGAFGSARDLGGSDKVQRGVGRWRGTPSFSAVGQTNGYDAALVLTELRHAGVRALGVVTPGALPHAMMAALKAQADLRVVDATDLIDTIKAVKSAEEIGLIRRTAALQDQVWAEVLDYIRPGLTDINIANHAQAVAHRLGSDQGIFLGLSARMGQSARFAGRQMQGRTLAKRDHFSLLIEVNGPGGLYLEIARTVTMGAASDAVLAGFVAVKAAQEHSLSLIRPGAAPAAIAAAHDAYMQAQGLPPETRLYAHGQGLDMVERPLIRADETLPLQAGMCLAVHPGFDDGTVFAVICDNYMVVEGGVSDCLHQTAKQVFELV